MFFSIVTTICITWALSVAVVLSIDNAPSFKTLLAAPFLVAAAFWPITRVVLVLLVGVSSVAMCSMAHAQTVGTDPAYANMQRAMGGIIQAAGASRGYVPSDPRTYKTMYHVGKQVVAGAAAAGSAILIGGTAPAWGTALAMAALSAGVYYAVDLGIDAAVQWAFGDDGSINMTASGIGQPSITLNNSVQNWVSSHPLLEDQTYSFSSEPRRCWQVTNSGGAQSQCCTHHPLLPGQYMVVVGHNSFGCDIYQGANYDGSLEQAANGNCPGGGTSTGWATCTAPSGVQTIAYPTIDGAASALTSSNLSQQVSPQALALMVNEFWRQAAALPGYDGIPYPASNPVTVAEVQTWMQANPGSVPTVQSLVTPVTNPSTDLAPSTSTQPSNPVVPVITETPPTATNPVQEQPQVNLGVDPNIGPPTLVPPTADSIFSPFMELVQPFINFQVNAPAGVCPKPVFSVFDTQHHMTQHCDILETLRPVISTVMSAVFVVAAFLIIFSA